jgi:hypothetical protein
MPERNGPTKTQPFQAKIAFDFVNRIAKTVGLHDDSQPTAVTGTMMARTPGSCSPIDTLPAPTVHTRWEKLS